jgi:membrane AbrB-like protein
MREIFTAFVIALVGVWVFHLVALPLPWLLGPIGACLVASLAGVRLQSIGLLNDGMRTILGVAVGATMTPQVLATFPAMWPTLMLVPVMVLVIAAVGVPYFQKLCGYDAPTAYYAAMPGGLQDMIVFGEEAGANVRALSLIHTTRVMLIVTALPFLMKAVWQVDLSNPPGAPLVSLPWSELLVMAGCAIAGWRIAKRLGMFGASILGPLILAALVTVTGFLHHRPPAEAIWAAQFFIGLSIGSKYTGITAREVKRDILAGVGFCGVLIVLTLVVVEIIYGVGLAPGLETLLAFAPGGQAELTVLALIVGADAAFVIAHHVLRIFIVILGAPLAARFFRAKV